MGRPRKWWGLAHLVALPVRAERMGGAKTGGRVQMGGRNEGGIMNVPCIGHYQFRNDTYSQPKILLYTPLSLPPLLPPLSPSLPSPSFAAPFAAPLIPTPHLRAPVP